MSKIITGRDFDAPSCFRWYAHDENYEGPAPDYEGDPIGFGEDEGDAIADYQEKLEWRNDRRARERERRLLEQEAIEALERTGALPKAATGPMDVRWPGADGCVSNSYGGASHQPEQPLPPGSGERDLGPVEPAGEVVERDPHG